MKRVLIAKAAGFCYGVQRAVDITLQVRKETADRVTSLGMVAHNHHLTDKLLAQGIESSADLGAVREGTIILSAHGVPPETRLQAEQQGLTIVDVTCPFVTRAQRYARQMVDQGYQVLLLGEVNHPEVRGIVGSADGKVTVIGSVDDLAGISLGRRVAIISQTTQQADMLQRVAKEVSAKAFEVRVFNTICHATEELQEAAVELAKKCDIAIVVGGRNSANTARLREIMEAEGCPSFHVESAAEIREAWLMEAETIGITAGASTPDWLIEEVARRVNGGELPEDFRIQHPDEKTMAKFFGETDNIGGRNLVDQKSLATTASAGDKTPWSAPRD
ncbi:MAG: 4-hydroxy-3-methylbut-2-enyl diphosphate reductase [Chthonomonadales bacterium]